MLKKILVLLMCLLLMPISYAIDIPPVGPSGPITGVGITGGRDVQPTLSCVQGCIAGCVQKCTTASCGQACGQNCADKCVSGAGITVEPKTKIKTGLDL